MTHGLLLESNSIKFPAVNCCCAPPTVGGIDSSIRTEIKIDGYVFTTANGITEMQFGNCNVVAVKTGDPVLLTQFVKACNCAVVYDVMISSPKLMDDKTHGVLLAMAFARDVSPAVVICDTPTVNNPYADVSVIGAEDMTSSLAHVCIQTADTVPEELDTKAFNTR